MKKYKSNQEWKDALERVIEKIQKGEFKTKKKTSRKKKESAE